MFGKTFYSAALLTVVATMLSSANAAEVDKKQYEGEDLTKGWYELRLHKDGFKASDNLSGPSYRADEGSDFHIVDFDEKTIEVFFTDVEGESKTHAKESVLYTIDADALKEKYWRRTKIAHGLLVVPFKFRSKDLSLSAESTLAYYLGIESGFLQGRMSFVGAAGLALIPVPTSTTKTEEKAGVSFAGGWIFESVDAFQIGAFAGIDHLGGDAGASWEYENDPWAAISIGFDFSR